MLKRTAIGAFFGTLLLFLSLSACGQAATSTPPPPTRGSSGGASATVPPDAGDTPAAPAITERRMLTLEFPPTIRAGDSELIRLTLEMDDRGNLTATAEVAGQVTQGQVIEIPNVYETHHLVAEARLDMAGPTVSPSGLVSESLRPGQRLNFLWSIQPAEVGHYQGVVWFYLRFVPMDGGPDMVSALSAQRIEIDAVDLFGFKASLVRWMGAGGMVLGTALGLPFIEEILKWLWKRFRK